MRLKEVYIEVDNIEYGIRPLSYDPGQEPSRRGHPDNWDAGSGPELELPSFVTIYVNGESVGTAPYDVMLLGVAVEERLPSIDAARAFVEKKCYEAFEDWYDEPDGEPEWERDTPENPWADND